MARALRPVPDTPPRAVLYLRQSISKEESISLALQERACRDFCDRQGYVVVETLSDPGISGRTWKRPAVQQTMDLIETRRADVIVLWRWSRLSRNRRDWALATDRVDVAGGRIESATEPNEVSTAAGRFQRGMMVELAAFESERIGEQWREVHASRIEQGLPHGTPPWGWNYTDRHTLTPDPLIAPVIVEMYRRYLDGEGVTSIGRWLNASGIPGKLGGQWHNAAIVSTLTTPIHCGRIRYKGAIIDGAHEGIIPVTTWEAVLAKRAARKATRPSRQKHLYTGLLTCAECGSACQGFPQRYTNPTKKDGTPGSSGVLTRYRCGAGGPKVHPMNVMDVKHIEPAVLAWLALAATDLDAATASAPSSDRSARADADAIAREITHLEKQLVQLTRHLLSGIVPEPTYVTARDELLARQVTLTSQLEALAYEKTLTPVDPSGQAAAILRDWDILPIAARRAALQALDLDILADFRAKKTTVQPRWSTVQ